MNKSKVAEIRKQKSLTQENLAEKAYVTVRTVQRVEAGEDVSNETLKSISNALDVTVKELFESVEYSEKEEEIMEISKQQQNQINYHKNEMFTIRLIIFGFIFEFNPHVLFLSKKLDKKYPMTIGMESKRVNKREEPVKNGWDFMARYWWILKLVNT